MGIFPPSWSRWIQLDSATPWQNWELLLTTYPICQTSAHCMCFQFPSRAGMWQDHMQTRLHGQITKTGECNHHSASFAIRLRISHTIKNYLIFFFLITYLEYDNLLNFDLFSYQWNTKPLFSLYRIWCTTADNHHGSSKQ